MANYASIEIRFYEIPDVGESLSFGVTFGSSGSTPYIRSVTEVAAHSRTSSRQFSISYDASSPQTPLIQVANNYREALLADFGSIQSMNVGIPLYNQAGYVGIVITFREYDDIVIFWNTVSTNVDAVVTDEVSPDPEFEITDITSQPAQDNPACTYQRLVFSVENETYPIQIKHFATGSEVTKVANDASELWIEVPRLVLFNGNIYLTSDYGGSNEEEATETIPLIALYTISEVQVFESLSGASINIIYAKSGGNAAEPLQFSLDGSNWQSSPQFSGLLGGNYTAYMIDSYGCVSTKDFTVEGLSTPRPDPYFKIEKANPLRFVNSATQTYRTVENTLFADQYPPNIEHRYWRQPWNIGDVIRTQIKTSYRNLSVNVINDCTGEVTQTIVPEKKSNFLEQTDTRDGIISWYSPTESIIYFPQGNIYNPTTGDVTDTYFNTTGQLPSFAQIGMVVQTEGNDQDGIFTVKDIVYSEDKGYWALLVDWTIQWSGGFINANDLNFSVKVTSLYNLENFDVYEFNFTENEGQYHVEIEATDESSNYPDLLYKSEPVWFDNHNNVVHLRYSSDDNQSGIFYDTGIVFELNVPGRFFQYSAGGEDESFTDDYGKRIIQKAVYLTQLKLETSLIPKWMAERIMIASLHENLFINGEEVTSVERPEIESKAGQNNPFYTVSGDYQLTEEIVREETTGIVSSNRSVLGTGSQTVIGV